MKKGKSQSKSLMGLREKAETILQKRKERIIDELSPEDARSLIHNLQIYQIELEMQNEELCTSHIRLEESRREYSDLYDFAPIGYFTLDKNGLILAANLTGADLLWTERSALIKKPFSRFIHRNDKTVFLVHCKQAFETKSRQSSEIRLMHTNGTQLYVRLDSIVTRDPMGKDNHLRVAVSDITERKEIELTLRDSEEKYRTLFDTATEAIYIVDPKTQNIIDCNPRASDITGYTVRELKSMKMKELYPPEEQAVISSIFRKINERGALSGVLGINQLRRDGRLVPVEMNATTIVLRGMMYTFCIIRDITSRKKIEKALRESEERYQRLSDATFEGIIIHENGTILDVNRTFARLFGYRTSDIVGKSALEFIAPEFRDPALTYMQSDRKKAYEAVGLKRNGSTFHMEIRSKSIQYEGHTARVASVRNITERKEFGKKVKGEGVNDHLTGLLSRRGFFALSEQQWKLAQRSKGRVSLLYVHINTLRKINNTYGRKKGDQALLDTAKTLRMTFPSPDIIGRLSGDDFAVLIIDPPHNIEQIIMKGVQKTLGIVRQQKKRKVDLSFTLGLAHYDHRNPCSVHELVARVDQLMDKARTQNRRDSQTTSLFEISKMEKRSHQRFRVSDTCTAELEGVSGNALLEDISLGGCRLKTSQQLKANISCRMRGFCEADNISSKSIPVWSGPAAQPGERRGPSVTYETGLKFVGLSKSEKQLLKSIISRLSEVER